MPRIKKTKQTSLYDHMSAERMEEETTNMAEGTEPPSLTVIMCALVDIQKKLHPIDLLPAKLDSMEKKIDDFNTRVTTVETRMTTVEVRMEEMGTRLTEVIAERDELEKEVRMLKKTGVESARLMAELDDQTRDKNVRILGLREGIESGNPTTLAARVLKDVFDLPELPSVDRAFRLPMPRGESQRTGPQRSRVMLVKMTSWPIKDKIMRQARRRRNELSYNGEKLLLSDDYSRATVALRATFKDVMRRFYDLKMSPSLLYPAKLRVTTTNGLRYFLDAQEAARFADTFAAGQPSLPRAQAV